MLTVAAALLVGLSLAACGLPAENNDNTTGNGTDNVQERASSSEKTAAGKVVENATDELATMAEQSELAAPVLEWWDLYHPNKYDTLAAAISNPNDVAIDVLYDVVFYKDGSEVARLEGYGNYDILPEKQDIIWVDAVVPASNNVDNVELENIRVSKAHYPAIDGTYEYVETKDGKAYFDFTFDRQPTMANVWFVLYNDGNKNGRPERGEVVATSASYITEQTGRVSFKTDVYAYTDYAVYYSAY